MDIRVSRPEPIEFLQKRIVSSPLPGTDTHMEMAHAIRRAEPDFDPLKSRDASVMITLYQKTQDDWHLLFIRRTSGHRGDKHSGQISFPGGKHEATDPDIMYTALREAHEETGIDLAHIDILGMLTPLYITVSRFLVHPFLAYSDIIPVWKAQEMEVAEIIEIPLKTFFDPAIRQTTSISLETGIRLNHVPAFIIGDLVIWGATAMILQEFLTLLQDAPSHLLIQ